MQVHDLLELGVRELERLRRQRFLGFGSAPASAAGGVGGELRWIRLRFRSSAAKSEQEKANSNNQEDQEPQHPEHLLLLRACPGYLLFLKVPHFPPSPGRWVKPRLEPVDRILDNSSAAVCSMVAKGDAT
jgi:hypothetical protein